MLSSPVRLKTLLGTSTTAEDELLAQLVLAAEGAVERYCHRTFDRREYVEHYDGHGQPDLVLHRVPVIDVLAVWLDSNGHYGDGINAFAAETLQTRGSDYVLIRDGESNQAGMFRNFGKTSADPSFQREFDYDASGNVDTLDYATYLTRRPNQSASGILRRLWGLSSLGWPWTTYMSSLAARRAPAWPLGSGNIKVNYVAGYIQESVPEDLRHAIDLWAKQFYLTRRTVGMIQSESLGERSISYFTGQMVTAGPPDAVVDLLRPYVDRAA